MPLLPGTGWAGQVGGAQAILQPAHRTTSISHSGCPRVMAHDQLFEHS